MGHKLFIADHADVACHAADNLPTVGGLLYVTVVHRRPA